MAYFNNHCILVDAQHGFRPGKSCETQLILTAEDLTKSIEIREQVDAKHVFFPKHLIEFSTRDFFLNSIINASGVPYTRGQRIS